MPCPLWGGHRRPVCTARRRSVLSVRRRRDHVDVLQVFLQVGLELPGVQHRVVCVVIVEQQVQVLRVLGQLGDVWDPTAQLALRIEVIETIGGPLYFAYHILWLRP